MSYFEGENKFFLFKPVHGKSQGFIGSLVGLPVIIKHNFCDNLSVKNLGIPSKLFNIVSDGNCFFRALSYIITGRQTYHSILRQKVISHMQEIENLLQPHLPPSVNDYLNGSQMARSTVWSTDVEILAASSLLETDIYVYTKVGDTFKWHKFSKSTLQNGSVPRNDCAIYLNHTGGVHYDVVLDVSSDFLLLYEPNCLQKGGKEQM